MSGQNDTTYPSNVPKKRKRPLSWCQICTDHVFLRLPKGIGVLLSKYADILILNIFFRDVKTVREPEHELTASDSDELSGDEPSELEDGRHGVHGNTAGKSTKSPDPELKGDDETDPFEDMSDRALVIMMNDQVRKL